MDITALNSVLNDSKIHSFYPFSFKKQTEESSVIINTGGTIERGGVYESHIQILTRDKHPTISIEKAEEIKKYLYLNVKGAFFNGKKILNVETTTPEPLFIGEENGLYLVSYNYILLESLVNDK